MALAAFQYPKKQAEYQGYRSGTPDRTGLSMPVLIGAALIAAAILLSTLITAVGTRFRRRGRSLADDSDVADRPAHRQRLPMPGRRARQGVLRSRHRDGKHRRPNQTLNSRLTRRRDRETLS